MSRYRAAYDRCASVGRPEDYNVDEDLRYYRLIVTRLGYDEYIVSRDREKMHGALIHENKPTSNAVCPTLFEFLYDVDNALTAVLPVKMFPDFYEAYIDTDDASAEKSAETVFGDRRHNLEYLVGQKFFDKRLNRSDYFVTVREWRDK